MRVPGVNDKAGDRDRRDYTGMAQIAKIGNENGAGTCDDSASFREWGTDEFGHYWYKLFFDGYVRKTWLTDPGDITSAWA